MNSVRRRIDSLLENAASLDMPPVGAQGPRRGSYRIRDVYSSPEEFEKHDKEFGGPISRRVGKSHREAWDANIPIEDSIARKIMMRRRLGEARATGDTLYRQMLQQITKRAFGTTPTDVPELESMVKPLAANAPQLVRDVLYKYWERSTKYYEVWNSSDTPDAERKAAEEQEQKITAAGDKILGLWGIKTEWPGLYPVFIGQDGRQEHNLVWALRDASKSLSGKPGDRRPGQTEPDKPTPAATAEPVDDLPEPPAQPPTR